VPPSLRSVLAGGAPEMAEPRPKPPHFFFFSKKKMTRVDFACIAMGVVSALWIAKARLRQLETPHRTGFGVRPKA
jgi:hypothetical protein